MGSDLYFMEEPFGSNGCCEFWPKHLERHWSVVTEVLGEKYSSHTAAAHLSLEAVAIGERGLKAGEEVRQVGLPQMSTLR